MIRQILNVGLMLGIVGVIISGCWDGNGAAEEPDDIEEITITEADRRKPQVPVRHRC